MTWNTERLATLANGEGVLTAYPMWRIVPDLPVEGSCDLYRRADDSTIIGSADEWRFYGSYPSLADAIGEVEETLAAEARVERRAQRSH